MRNCSIENGKLRRGRCAGGAFSAFGEVSVDSELHQRRGRRLFWQSLARSQKRMRGRRLTITIDVSTFPKGTR